MQKERNIVLHIGMPKTGTTALQSFLSDHTDQLLQSRIIYPKAGRRSNQHFFLASPGMASKPLFVQSWKDLALETTDISWRTMILSSERFFYHLEPEKIKEVCEPFDANIHIVLFLRNHIDAVKSLYRTAIKSLPRVCCTAHVYTDFLIQKNASSKSNRKNDLLNYNAVIERWQAVFQEENIHVISYDEISKTSNTIESFFKVLQQIGIPSPVFTRNQLAFRTHQTKPDLILDLLLRTNQFFFGEQHYWKFIRHLFEKDADASVTTRDMQFSEQDAQSIISFYGNWDNASTNIGKLLKTDKTILTDDERKSKQLEILSAIDPDWQDILEQATSLPLEQIVDLKVMNTPLTHYKALYERDYGALKYKLDREAYKMNKDKRDHTLNSPYTLEHAEGSMGVVKNGIRNRLRCLLFKA